MSLNMLASVAGMIDATSDLDFAAYSDPVLQEEFQSILDNTKALNEPISAPPQFKPVEHWDPHYDDFRHARWPYLDAFQDESIHRHFKNDVTMECATINCRGLDRFMYPIPNEMGICTILKEDFFTTTLQTTTMTIPMTLMIPTMVLTTPTPILATLTILTT